MKDGILLVDKPEGLTSHDVVDRVRKSLRIRRVGHAGTLDPLATGVLIILIGKATKLFNKFSDLDKEYIAVVTLGKITTTGDSQGTVVEERDFSFFTEKQTLEVFNTFLGEGEQIPPMVSAIKYKGKKLYQLARQGIEVPRKPRKVIIKELKLLRFQPPEIEFYLRCSKGTYVRKLAEDMGAKLGCGGYVSKIQRISIGSFHIKDTIDLKAIDESHIRPWQN